MNGCKTGGRTAGTPNKRTLELADRLAELGCDPVEGLAQIAADPGTDPALRARVLADLLPYLYPKRKAVDISTGSGSLEAVFRWLPTVEPRASLPEGSPQAIDSR